MISTLAMHAAEAVETAEKSGGVNHWVVGGIVLVILLASLGILMAFGGGREHS
ncbi:hypothetical protein [Nocardioides nematodiphilus]|jgi:hypothetical protein|uniref:hypothetical protein n=1 Tax=Nocardioides nematodiphilus TaxID=2849669 RepID=UPI001CD9B84D|nr:hypothetical protein [Nocardioides nematodiphilus]MCA1982296.1 hypothetical protein [Nocardioides nematodiphilus]